jgi:glycine hydroxymethyltransferase
MALGYHVVSGGTDNHLILVDLTNKNIPGKLAAKALDKAGIELNYNSVPYDTRRPFDPSGIRLGSPSVTSRGMGATEMKQIVAWMDRVMSNPNDDNAAHIAVEVRELTNRFPAPGIPVKA